MKARILAGLSLFALLSMSVTAPAQTTGTSSNEGDSALATLADGTVTPGEWVGAAMLRHRYYTAMRVTLPQYGVTPKPPTEVNPLGNSSSNGLSGLQGLLGLLGSGGLGSLDGLTSLISGAGSSSSTNTPTDTGSSSGSQYTLEDLLALRDANNGGAASSTASRKSTTAAANRPTSGGISRLPKPATFQTSSSDTGTTTDTRSFGLRYLDAMLQTTFTALTAGAALPQFEKFLEKALWPLFERPATTSAQADTSNSSNDTNTGTNNDTSGSTPDTSGSDNTGGTIEDVPSTSTDNNTGTV